MSVKLTPAQCVIVAFSGPDGRGGVSETARIVGRNPASVSRWNMSKEKKGLEGRVPLSVWDDILAEAYRRGLHLTIWDLKDGRTVPEERGSNNAAVG